MTLEEGDRVVCTEWQDGINLIGKTGTIVKVSTAMYGIRFDEPQDGMHDLDFRLEEQSGFWVDKSKVKLGKITNWKQRITK